MKRKIILIVGTFLLIVSIGLALYPTVSEQVNKQIANDTISQYNNLVDSMDTEQKNNYFSQARKYNDNLSNIISDSFSPDAYNVDPSYSEILDFADNGQIGTISIPSINCNLPIYHGIDESYLDLGAVHMCNTSFPIGGNSTHGVISAHTAYPGKEFFNNLTKLTIGDYFYVSVLGKTLAYKVCEINVVLPNDTELLKIADGRDLITLVTCTPYSVNSHRLLVTGERDTSAETKESINNSINCDKGIPLYLYLIPVITIVVIILLIILKRRRNNDTKTKPKN